MLRPWNWYKALRQQGFKAERDYLNRKLKAQFNEAAHENGEDKGLNASVTVGWLIQATPNEV